MLEDVLLADQRVQQGSHAEDLADLQLAILALVLEPDGHRLFVLTKDAVVERALRECAHLCKLLLDCLAKLQASLGRGYVLASVVTVKLLLFPL